MEKIKQLLQEMEFKVYQTIVYIKFKDTTNITNISQQIRGLEHVTIVNNKTDKTDLKPHGFLQIKVITIKTGIETFHKVKEEAIRSMPDLTFFNFKDDKIHLIETI
jgi:hypothetical protein